MAADQSDPLLRNPAPAGRAPRLFESGSRYAVVANQVALCGSVVGSGTDGRPCPWRHSAASELKAFSWREAFLVPGPPGPALSVGSDGSDHWKN